jgi:translation initiation factor IF-2
MTDNKKDNSTKLVIASSKLSLKKPIGGTPTIAKSVVGATSSKTIVEVKKSKLTPNSLSLNKITKLVSSNSIEGASEEFNKRLNILKKAAEEAKNKESDSKISTLSKLAAMNQQKVTEVTNKAAEKELLPESFEAPTISAVTDDENKDIAIEVKKAPTLKSYDNLEVIEDLVGKDISESKVPVPKPKLEEPKRLKKKDIFQLLDDDDTDSVGKTRSLASIKRAKEKEKRKLTQVKQEKIYREVVIPETINVGELSNRMAERVADVIKELMKLGIIASSSQSIDADTAELIATTFGHSVKRVQESDVENILIIEQDDPKDLQPRAPVVTVMGHVDHGKTSLLDALRATDVLSGEAGGITQHIGAYRVTLSDNRKITFIDTPGHEAFTQMRTRGTKITDIVVLVVAADDGVKAQTIEAISHAKAANVPIIVAINKADKPDVNLERIKNELLNYDVIAEDFGGDVMVVPVSALQKINLDKLEEAILLLSDMLELKANSKGSAAGVVVEARIDKGKGVIVTVLVQRGSLKIGDIVVAGSVYGKVKRMNNDKLLDITAAYPSEPVEIYGLNDSPLAGDTFNVVQNEKQARDITEYRLRKSKERKISVTKRASLEDLFIKASGGKGTKELSLIIKGDVQGSIEAIIETILKLQNDEVKLRILHSAVGGITESDISLAKASNAIILGFNVKANYNPSSFSDKDKVDIRYYSIIYNLIDDLKMLMNNMLDPIIREQYIGSVEIRQIFEVSKVGKIAGSYVTKGIIRKGAKLKLLRDNVIIHEGKLKTLKRFKDDVKEVKENFECGIAFENYDDIKVGDRVEVFEVIEEKQKLF